MAGFINFMSQAFSNPGKSKKDQKDALVDRQSFGQTTLESFFGGDAKLTEDQILGIPAVNAAVETITGSISQLPVELYKPNEEFDSFEPIYQDNRLNLLNKQTNESLNAYNFKKKIVRDVLLYGSSKSYIKYDSEDSNNIVGIYPLNMNKVTIEVRTDDGFSYYGTDILQSAAGTKIFYDDLMLSILKDSDNGITGRGVIEGNEDTLKLAIQQSAYEQNLLNNGATPMSVLETDSKMNDNQLSKMNKTWKRLFNGVNNAGKTAILEEGLHFKSISLNPDNMQLSQGRKSVISDISRMFNIPESMINSAANKYDSNEQNNLWFLQTTLNPIIVSIEAALNKTLLTSEEQELGYKFVFNTDPLTKITKTENTDIVIKKWNAGLISSHDAIKALGDKIGKNVVDYKKQTTGEAMYIPDENKIVVPNTGIIMDIKTGKIIGDGLLKSKNKMINSSDNNQNLTDNNNNNNEGDSNNE